MILFINLVAGTFTIFEYKVPILPEAADTFHMISFAVIHQFFREETGKVADTANNVTAENVIIDPPQQSAT